MASNNFSQKAHVAHMQHRHHSRRNTAGTKLSIATKAVYRPGLPRALSSPRLASLGRRRTATDFRQSTSLGSDDTNNDMTTSFLQFCAFCEKQIAVPNHSILYCSERCRRKDIGDSADASLPLSPKRSPPLSPQLSSVLPLMPPRAPSTLSSFGRKPSMLHAAKADLDPTEWKPHSMGGSGTGGGGGIEVAASEGNQYASRAAGGRPTHTRARSSAALSFLAQFHRAPDAVSFAPRAREILAAGAGSALAHTAPQMAARPFGIGFAELGGGDGSSSSPSDLGSVPPTPREAFIAEALRVTAGSTSSLKSLAAPVECLGHHEPVGLVGVPGSWMPDDTGVKGEASGSLRRLLEGV